MFVGVLLSALFFANKVGRLLHIANHRTDDGERRVYEITGQVFFASATTFRHSFDFDEALPAVTIDVHRAHFWDISAVEALDRVVLRLRREGTTVEIVGMNEASKTLVDKVAVHDKPDADKRCIWFMSASPTIKDVARSRPWPTSCGQPARG